MPSSTGYGYGLKLIIGKFCFYYQCTNGSSQNSQKAKRKPAKNGNKKLCDKLKWFAEYWER